MKTAVVLGTVAVIGAGGAAYLYQRSEAEHNRAARAVIAQLAAGWQAGDVTAVPFADPDAAASFTPAVEGLGATGVTVEAGSVQRNGDRASSDLAVSWTLPGEVDWGYTVPVAVQRAGDDTERWEIAEPAAGSYWHPGLNPGDTMAAKRTDAVRGDLLDRNGKPLMPLGTVYPVQLDPARATAETAAELERLVEAEPGSLVAKLKAATTAGSKAPIPAITYREQDFAARRAELDALTGVVYPKTVQPLAADRSFAQPLLGSFAEVTAEIVEAGEGRYAAGDRAGISGLQRSYDTVLAGTPGIKVTTTTGKILFEQACGGRDRRPADPRPRGSGGGGEAPWRGPVRCRRPWWRSTYGPARCSPRRTAPGSASTEP